jgi:hypothetical protein
MKLGIRTEIGYTSNAEKMDILIAYLGIEDRVIDQRIRLGKISPGMDEPAFVYDTWTQRTPDGEKGAFGLATYLSLDQNDQLSLGMEFLMCKSIRKLERAFQQMKDKIDLPINLLLSREQQAAFDRADSIDRSRSSIIRKRKK